jgi:hypothetical protein
MKKFFISAIIALSAMSANATNGIFRIVNNSVEPIVNVYVSPPNRTQYGKTDLLGERVIYPGNSAVVDPGRVQDSENKCVLDVLALGDNGSKWEMRMNVCEVTTWTLTGGKGQLL